MSDVCIVKYSMDWNMLRIEAFCERVGGTGQEEEPTQAYGDQKMCKLRPKEIPKPSSVWTKWFSSPMVSKPGDLSSLGVLHPPVLEIIRLDFRFAFLQNRI